MRPGSHGRSVWAAAPLPVGLKSSPARMRNPHAPAIVAGTPPGNCWPAMTISLIRDDGVPSKGGPGGPAPNEDWARSRLLRVYLSTLACAGRNPILIHGPPTRGLPWRRVGSRKVGVGGDGDAPKRN